MRISPGSCRQTQEGTGGGRQAWTGTSRRAGVSRPSQAQAGRQAGRRADRQASRLADRQTNIDGLKLQGVWGARRIHQRRKQARTDRHTKALTGTGRRARAQAGAARHRQAQAKRTGAGRHGQAQASTDGLPTASSREPNIFKLLQIYIIFKIVFYVKAWFE